MEALYNFLSSVAASIAGYYICKLFDRRHRGS